MTGPQLRQDGGVHLNVRTLALTLCLLLVPAAFAQASRAGAKHSKVTLTACDTAADTATFSGAMTRVRHSTTMQMRFTLQARVPGGGGFKHVVAPEGSTFDTWLSSTPGKKGYVYDKAVENLEDGASYRAIVRFRWKDADGDTVARALKATDPCRQPDLRPNLKVKSVSVRPGTSPSTRTYVVRVVNRGASDAPAFATGLVVNGAPLADQPSEPLAARSDTLVSFPSPKCDEGSTLTAAVDTMAAVDERDETDNTLAVPCPTGSR